MSISLLSMTPEKSQKHKPVQQAISIDKTKYAPDANVICEFISVDLYISTQKYVFSELCPLPSPI